MTRGGAQQRGRVDRCWAVLLALVVLTSLGTSCGGGSRGGDDDPPDDPPPALEESRTFRAIAGVSMGGYGALNLGTKYPELFGTIASLGGPVSMLRLLGDSIEDNLEVKAQTIIPRAVGEDFTFDHLPPYPERDSRISMFQDLSIAFGNPFLHHPDPERRYLARDSEPAALGEDDQFGSFTPREFADGGDANEDGLRQLDEIPTTPTDVMLLAGDTLASLAPGAVGVDQGGRRVADLDGDGVFDVGDGIVVNYAEPFTDANANLTFEPALGETFDDLGLDGVAGSGDFGEGNGTFDYDPDRARWLAEDPLTRLAERTAAEIRTQRLYMDVGIGDELGFARHYDALVAVLTSKGIAVATQDGFDGNCVDLPDPSAPFLLARYPAGHIGFESVDGDDLLSGDVCGTATVWQRIVTMIGFLNESFPDGVFGPGAGGPEIDVDLPGLDLDFEPPSLDPRGDLVRGAVPSPALAHDGAVPMRDLLVYRPPAFFRTDEDLPIVYFLGGYGQEPDDFELIRVLLDALILSGQLQNVFMAFLPGEGGRQGTFYVNHALPADQVPDLDEATSGRFEDSILEDLIPLIEQQILDGRVRRE